MRSHVVIAEKARGRRQSTRSWLVLLLALPTLACGGSDAQCVIDTDCPLFNRCMAEQCVPIGSVDASMDTSVPSDSGPPDAPPMDSAVDTGTTLEGTGSVAVSQSPLPMAMFSHSLAASFARDGGAGGCTVTEGTPCTITECITAPPTMGDAGMADAGMADAGTPTAPHAGQIDVSGAMVELTISPGMDGTYPPATGTAQLYAGGESLNVIAAGGDVPAFEATVTAPGSVDVTSPSLTGGLLMIDRSMDFPVAWTEGMAVGNVIVRFSGFEMMTDGGSRNVSLACSFDGSSGMGTVPASALGNLPGGGASGAFSVETSMSTDVMAGGWLVTVNASSIARAEETGGAASAGTTYP